MIHNSRLIFQEHIIKKLPWFWKLRFQHSFCFRIHFQSRGVKQAETSTVFHIQIRLYPRYLQILCHMAYALTTALFGSRLRKRTLQLYHPLSVSLTSDKMRLARPDWPWPSSGTLETRPLYSCDACSGQSSYQI